MKSTELFSWLAAFLTLIPVDGRADPSGHLPTGEFRWIHGATTVSLPEVARLKIPAGYAFLSAAPARALLQSLGNQTSGNEVGLITSGTGDWSVVIEFYRVGRVPESQWESPDANAILEAIRTANRQTNLEREQNGWPVPGIEGWESAPVYDSTTRSMEWAVRAISEGSIVINRVISVLARQGVVRFVLVDRSPTAVSAAAFRGLVHGLTFEPGERYVDWRPGDRTAPEGLTPSLDASEAIPALESSGGSTSGAPRRGWSSPGRWWWAAGGAGLPGFLIGWSVGRRHRRRHHSRAFHPRGAVNHRNEMRSPLPVGATLPLEQPDGASADGTAPTTPGLSDPGERLRRRRCDAYSFYARLTRDLHWTIKY